MSQIKAIETRYAGCRFRSRLEARWAVFFDHLGVKWEYEDQGFEVGETRQRYLPDFYLPELKVRVEVKGDRSDLDLQVLADTIWDTRSIAILILGPVPFARPGSMPLHSLLVPTLDFRPDFGRSCQTINEFCRAIEPLSKEAQGAVERMVAANDHPVSLMHFYFIHTTATGFMPVGFPLIGQQFDLLEPKPVWDIVPMPRVQAAYTAARSARFEHGEEG